MFIFYTISKEDILQKEIEYKKGFIDSLRANKSKTF